MGDAAGASQEVLPDWIVRLSTLADPSFRQIVSDLRIAKNATREKARRVLGWIRDRTKTRSRRRRKPGSPRAAAARSLTVDSMRVERPVLRRTILAIDAADRPPAG